MLWSALQVGSTSVKVGLSGRGKRTYGKNQGRTASGAPARLNCCEFPADIVGMECGFSLCSSYAWPSHLVYRALQSLRAEIQCSTAG